MQRIIRSSGIQILALLLFSCAGPPEYGPSSGILMIIGGAATEDNYRMFIELAGGSDAKIVVVPTAGGRETYDGESLVQRWKERYGATNVVMLHTVDREEADSEDFVKDLKDADAVFFSGGRQWRLVDAYMNTRTYEEFHKVLERGGVIAGSSAGASIQASFLARGAESGNTLMIAPELEHQAGFGFLRNAAVDQHIDRRNRWNDLREIIMVHPELLGIGIAEGTAIVVKGDIFEIVGKGQIAIHDYYGTFTYTDSTYYQVLDTGEWYDMKARRKIEKPAKFY